MSTMEHNRLAEGVAVDIVGVKHVGDYVLQLRFNDDTSREINFEPFLRSSPNPDIRTYLEPAKFGSYVVKDGELIWGDFELCFPIADLYEGRI